MIDAIKLIDYNIWANSKILEQAKSFPSDQLTKELGGSFPSVRLTLVHLMESDWVWMHRWKGIPLVAVPSEWTDYDVKAIGSTWLDLQNQMKDAARVWLTSNNKEIQFKTRKGDPITMLFVDTVIHAVNHGTYHRGQIVNMIRMLGEKPVNTDYFIFCTAK